MKRAVAFAGGIARSLSSVYRACTPRTMLPLEQNLSSSLAAWMSGLSESSFRWIAALQFREVLHELLHDLISDIRRGALGHLLYG